MTVPAADADDPPPAWAIGLGAIALIGLLAAAGYAYLRGLFQTAPDYTIVSAPSLDDPHFGSILEGLANAADTRGHLVGFWSTVDEIFAARTAAIQGANHRIQYETYFMTPGRRADAFAEVIADRAIAGVQVQLLFDHQGTRTMPQAYWRRLRNLGVEIRFFRCPNWRSPLEYNSRSHRKLLILDGQRVYIGGAGISDHWDGTAFAHDLAPWLDFELAYEGEVVPLLQGKFLQNWAYSGGNLDLTPQVTRSPDPDGVSLYITDDTSTLNESAIRLMVQLTILAAKTRLWIASPYFIPDANTVRALVAARQRGVDVRVLTMGHATDKPLVHLASRELYGPLLRSGIALYEHQPSMLHAKALLADEAWVSTGSANLDPRSYFHNDELNLSGLYPELAQKLEGFFLQAFECSRHLSYPDWQARPRRQRLKGRTALLAKNLL